MKYILIKRIPSLVIVSAIIIFAFNSCKKDKELSTSDSNIKVTINGSAQKGPFVNGTSITIFELDTNYSQTGKSFSTQIIDNAGSFQLNDIILISKYIQIRADGFYFNEVCGSNSASQITLNCISKISSPGSVHINLLTHLEKPRVEYLLSAGIPFDSAKSEAQREVLNIFNISLNSTQVSENLDISQTGDGNAALLAVSSILQGLRTESELSSTLALISNDIRTDGILNNATIKSSLIDHALLLDTVSIRNNLSNFYTGLSMSVSIPDFEKYIRQFITTTTFPITNSVISYPATGMFGSNILFKSQLVYSGSNFTLSGLSKKCSHLTLRLHLISGTAWMYTTNTNNMNISTYDYFNNEQYFTVINPELPFDVNMIFDNPGGTYLIEYFEVNSTSPSFSKTITVN